MAHRPLVIFVVGIIALALLGACSNSKSADVVMPTLAVLPGDSSPTSIEAIPISAIAPTIPPDIQSGVDQFFTQTAQAKQQIAPTETIVAAFNQALTATAQSLNATLRSEFEATRIAVGTSIAATDQLDAATHQRETSTAQSASALQTYQYVERLLRGDISLQQTATALPANCILYAVEEGDTPYGIAAWHGIDGAHLMMVNGLEDDQWASLLQIGDVLIVPLPGCTLTASPTRSVPTPPPPVVPTFDAGDTPIPLFVPTPTLFFGG